MKNSIEVNQVSDLTAVAHSLLQEKRKGVIALYGDMGAGKTTLVSAICSYLGCRSAVSSPTFSIVQEYQVTQNETVYHFDFYRIRSEKEALDLGAEMYFYSGDLCLVEWPENVQGILPADFLAVQIETISTHSRLIRF
jgi:tRNA threonylcarbamoyladenosine biosynthesis protein TsaE